jgi:PAS domain S-box-containing protein
MVHKEKNLTDPTKTKVQLGKTLTPMPQQMADPAASEVDYHPAQQFLQTELLQQTNLLQNILDAVILTDLDFHIQGWNQGAEKVYGWRAEEVMGHRLEDVVPHKYPDGQPQEKVIAELMVAGQWQGEVIHPHKNGASIDILASVTLVNDKIGQPIGVVAVNRDITDRKRIEREREQLILQLKTLNEATQAITSELSLEQALFKIAQFAKDFTQTKYAALGIHDGHGRLSQFVTAGVSQAEQVQIGTLPSGQGLLGVLLHQGQSLIIEDMAHHPAAVGFPDHHPAMHSLLGVPIYAKGELLGDLYLADKENGSKFTEIDQQLVEMLALHAANAIENARLYEKTQRLAIFEERERLARDLHDGIIQSFYGVGLSLENAKAVISPDDEATRNLIDLCLDSLAQIITDIRAYIFDLRPQALANKSFLGRLQGLVKELQANRLLSIKSEIDPKIESYVDDVQAGHLFYIAHEALSNVARHAVAHQVLLRLGRLGEVIQLQIEDDGIGFELPAQINPGHHGLANMQARVSLLDATLHIDSAPQQGTRVTITLPISPKYLNSTS